MRSADLRVPGRFPARGRLYTTGVALAALLVGVVSCKGTVTQRVPDADYDKLLGCLPPDESDGVDSAWDIVADGTEQEGNLLCPKYDDDFWHLNVVGDRQLMHVVARYESPGNVELSLDWLGPKRVCMDASPAPCTTAAECTGQLCDALRGGCRDSQAELCYQAGHCTGETCTLGEADNLAPLIPESASGVNLHIVDTIVPAFIPGDYYLRVYDHAGNAEDDLHPYTLTLTQFQDLDVNEPNNSVNMATPVTDSVPVTGYFSYRGDVDVYQLTPGFAGVAVLYIDLLYNSGTEAEPTWTVVQEGAAGPTQFLPPLTGTVPGTGGFDYSLNAAHVLVSNAPITITVTNPSGVADPDAHYQLRVHVFADSDENPRDDRVGDAQAITTNGSASQRIVADNDVDWYHVTTAGGSNSVVDVSLVANTSPPAMSPLLLKYQVYYLTGDPCSACPVNDLALPYGAQKACLQDTVAGIDDCADVFQRPQIFTPENWPNNWGDEYGGPTPNELSARIPVYPSREMYILVQHTKNTPLVGYPGYDETATYTLTLTEHTEPDPDDASNTDNHFVPEPLEGEYVDDRWRGVSYDTLHIRDRSIAGGWSQSGGGSVGENFAMLTSTALPVTACTPLTVEMFNDAGTAITAGTVNINSTDFVGAFFTDATCTVTGNSFVFPGATPHFQWATVAPTGTITTNMGGTAIPFAAQVYSGTATPQLAFAGPRSGELGGRSGAITASIPAAAGAAVDVALATAGNPTQIVCAATGQSGDACAQPTTCTLAGSASCAVTVPIGETERGFFIIPSDSGAPQLTILTATAPGYLGATWVYAPRDPVVLSFSSAGATGWITYEGDSDFFTIPMPDPSLGAGTMTATLTYTGNADLRVGIVRQPNTGDWCTGSCGISITPGNCSGSPCTVGVQSSCYYVTSSGAHFNVWVNDEDSDDYDHPTAGGGSAYQFTFDFQEGCAGFCHEYACQ